MQNHYVETELDRQRRETMLRDSHLANLADAGSTESPFYAPLLAQIGGVLVRLGEDLQSRYTATEMPALTSDPACPPSVAC